MAGFREAGAAFIRFFVKDETKAGLDAAQRNVTQATAKIQDSVSGSRGIFGGLKDIRTALNSTLGVVLSLVSKATLITGLIWGAVEAARAFIPSLARAREEAEQLAEAVSKATAEAAKIREASADPLQSELDRLDGLVSALLKQIGVLKRVGRGDDSEALQADVEVIRKQQEQLFNDRIAKQIDAENAAHFRRAKELQEESEKQQAIAEEVARIQEENRLQDWRDRMEAAKEELRLRVETERELSRIAAERLKAYQDVIDSLSGTSVTSDQRAQTALLQIIANKVGRGSY